MQRGRKQNRSQGEAAYSALSRTFQKNGWGSLDQIVAALLVEAESNLKVCEICRVAVPLQKPVANGETILLNLQPIRPLFAMILEAKRTGNATHIERFASALGYLIQEQSHQWPKLRGELFGRWISVADSQKGPPFSLPLTLAELFKEVRPVFDGSKTELRRRLLAWGFTYKGQKHPKH